LPKTFSARTHQFLGELVRAARAEATVLSDRIMDFILSIGSGQSPGEHIQVHNLFLTIFCPINAVHPFAHFEERIDKLVYQLYGLTAEEIAIIERDT
jgi:hypothetical protein